MASEDSSDEDLDFGDQAGKFFRMKMRRQRPLAAEDDKEDIGGLLSTVLDLLFERDDGLKTWYTNFYYLTIPESQIIYEDWVQP